MVWKEVVGSGREGRAVCLVGLALFAAHGEVLCPAEYSKIINKKEQPRPRDDTNTIYPLFFALF